jgi:protein SCO1/2
MTPRGALALGALAVILAVTASWWALALWPMPAAAPEWLARTRQVCFGAGRDTLPDAGGWILLIGEPIGLAIVLVVIWGGELLEGLTLAMRRPLGRVVLAGTALGILAGLGVAARIVAEARGEPFALGSGPDVTETLASSKVNDPAPALGLVDQRGDSVTLAGLQGRPVIVTFAFGHCTTVCPVTVRAARAAAERLRPQGAVLLVVTLDPWRDTPSRLASVADEWQLGEGMHVLSGDIATVEHTLSAWRVPRARNPATGDLSHPTMVYVVSPAGRITYALGADTDAIVAAVSALQEESQAFRARPGGT